MDIQQQLLDQGRRIEVLEGALAASFDVLKLVTDVALRHHLVTEHDALVLARYPGAVGVDADNVRFIRAAIEDSREAGRHLDAVVLGRTLGDGRAAG